MEGKIVPFTWERLKPLRRFWIEDLCRGREEGFEPGREGRCSVRRGRFWIRGIAEEHFPGAIQISVGRMLEKPGGGLITLSANLSHTLPIHPIDPSHPNRLVPL
ncbi:MAG: hypothetical protein HY201_01615 [Nitrospirae bacterium]|nr:hypothetical protein [Candidatus Troglogloeales bacterium]